MKQYLVALILLFKYEAISGHVIEHNHEVKGKFLPDYDEINGIQIGVYHIFITKVNWTEAVKQCRSKNMELISIPSEEDNDKIIEAIQKANQGKVGFWTSGNRRNTNGIFRWGNGKPIGPFTNWELGYPDNMHAKVGWEEECIEIKGYHILKWNDHLCGYPLYYICESNEISVPQISTNNQNKTHV